MKKFTVKQLAFAIAAQAAFSGVAVNAVADDAMLEEVVVLGSRGAPRSATDSPVPVDVLSAADMAKTGSTDMLELLKGTVPSFNVHDNPISDAASMIRPANLRGLSADSTLILVNGKRRHRSSVIAFQGGGINDGAQGPDLSVIPSTALKQVEVLRDGAAAQYGSDAIAGVMNFVLRDDAEGGAISVKSGEYFEGDGASTIVDGWVGMPLTKDGFVNISFQYKNQDDTSRSVQRPDAAELIAAGNTAVPEPAQVWGQPIIDDDITIFVNSGLDLGNGAQAYIFGNYSERDVDGGFYYRNPNDRGGVYTNGGVRLVGDLTGDMSGNCSQYATAPTANGSDMAGVFADDNCFVFNEMIPGGYTPRFTGNITDTSLTAGTRGESNGINYDVSASVGRNASSFGLNNTINPSMGPDSPRNFDTGQYIQLEKSINVDLQKQYGNTSVAGGYEWREESFQIIAGETASWQIGPLASQGFNVGSHGFAGFSADSAGTFTRRNYAVYLDVESQVSDELLLGGALRFEDFSSFGSTTNYKLTAHYQLTDELALRASHSTGFRAPTMGQANVVNTQTTFNESNELIQVQTMPARLLGLAELQPEESTNFAIGLIYAGNNFDVTVDTYQIEVTDRVALTPVQDVQASWKTSLQNAGIPVPNGVNFFANDFDTTTSGVDIVATTSADLFGGVTNFSLAYNYNKTEVDNLGQWTSDFKKQRLEEGLPKTRFSATAAQSWDNVDMFVRANYYGEYYAVHADWFGETADTAITVDVEATYHMDNIDLTAGAQNVFDKEAQRIDGSIEGVPDGVLGGIYYETSPYGINGGFYYVKATYNF